MDEAEFNSSIEEMKKLLEKVRRQAEVLAESKNEESYRDGFCTGFSKGFELGTSDLKLNSNEIDWNSIEVFAKFCYMHGIDFSYMGKAEDTESFTDRVINKFKEELEKELIYGR